MNEKEQILKPIFIAKESHKHRLAKELLAGWMQEEEKKEHSYGCQIAQFRWSSNYGVFTELKFYETSDPFYFECGANKGKFLFTPDITVFHKGSPKYIIEIIHKNRVTKIKLDRIKKFFDGNDVEVYEIEAERLLSYTNLPERIICKRLM